MPGVTTLAFYREKQTIASFEEQRPKSLQALRQAASAAIDGLLLDLSEIEQKYLGQRRTHQEHIRGTTGFIRILMDASGYREIVRKNDFEVIWDRVNSLGERTTAYLDFMRRLRDLQAHISEFNPSAFTKPMADVQMILQYMEKYCLSFYTGPTMMLQDPRMETPFMYETHRRERAMEIRKMIKQIPDFMEQYNGAGLSVSKFSDNCQQLAGQCDCYQCPFFLLFPASMEILRDTCKLLMQWLEEDKEYLDCLTNDIQKFTQEHQAVTSEYREEYERLHKLKHRSDTLGRDLDAGAEEMMELRGKRPIAEAELHEALVRQKKCELARQTAKFRLTELAKHALGYSPDEFQKAVAQQKRILRTQRARLPDVNKHVDRAEKKVRWFEAKDASYEAMRKERAQLVKESEGSAVRLKVVREKMGKIEEAISKLRSIYNLKVSTSTLKKVFHNLQFQCRSHMMRRERSLPSITLSSREKTMDEEPDQLSIAFEVVSRLIEQDWSRLYLALPFHPSRGQSELEYDVDRINKKFVRGNRQELAQQCLVTWRRLHTRANLEGLMQGLAVIGREDIGRRATARINRRTRPNLPPPPMSPTTRMLARRQRQLASSPQTPRNAPRMLTDDTIY